MKGRGFTGRHMTAILVVFFGVVIAVNFTMARYARATFGGLVVENSYVASQEFNQWLDEAEAGDALGWDAVTAWRPDGRLLVTVSGPGSWRSLPQARPGGAWKRCNERAAPARRAARTHDPGGAVDALRRVHEQDRARPRHGPGRDFRAS